MGATISMELYHVGNKFSVTISPTKEVNVRIVRDGANLQSTHAAGAMKLAAEYLREAVVAVDAARAKFVSTRAKRGRAESSADPDTPPED